MAQWDPNNLPENKRTRKKVKIGIVHGSKSFISESYQPNKGPGIYAANVSYFFSLLGEGLWLILEGR